MINIIINAMIITADNNAKIILFSLFLSSIKSPLLLYTIFAINQRKTSLRNDV